MRFADSPKRLVLCLASFLFVIGCNRGPGPQETGGHAASTFPASAPIPANPAAESLPASPAAPAAAPLPAFASLDRRKDRIEALAVARELSSPGYAGRLAGSPGGAAAGAWIAAQLASLGLAPDVIEFAERVPVFVREASLAVSIPGGEIREFANRRDFREITRGGWSEAQAEGPLALVEGPETPFRSGSIVALSGRDYDHADDERFLDKGARGILLVLDGGMIEKRPLYAGQAPGRLLEPRRGLVKMAISPEVFYWLSRAAAQGGRARLVNPQDYKEVRCRDYLARWNGDGGDFRPSFLLVAHYDHVGPEAEDGSPGDAEIFPGALDNGSGVGFLLSLAENFSRDGIPKDVAFLFTDAEEINLSGAAAFLGRADFLLRGLRVLNFDMLGAQGERPLSLFSGDDAASLELAQELVAALERSGIAARSEHPVLNVDSGPFGAAGARAVTLCEYVEELYHTSRDSVAELSAPELTALEEAIYRYLLESLASAP